KATLSLYCQGLNQSASGTAKNAALVNLHLATGQIGRAGAGPLSLTGQPNAMGGREVGGMANLLSAHRDLANPGHRAEVAKLWGIESVPERPGRTAVEMFEAIRAGEIKALWIACTNPAQSLPDQKLVHEALERAELVVVQDAYRNTETTRYAHVLLPAAGWGEKEGTMTNSERRISRVRKAVPPPGEARADWDIACAFGAKLSVFLGRKNILPYREAEEIFNEHRESTRGRDLDITGLSYALLDVKGAQQWPFPEGAHAGRKRLYEDGVFPTATSRARFVATAHAPVAEEVSDAYPLRLNTGRLRDQWHTLSRTGTVARLFTHDPEPRAFFHPKDLARLGIGAGELVKLRSRRGEAIAIAAADEDLLRGNVFLPMHWGARFLGGAGSLGVNALTVGALDPVSRQPELKHCAVAVERAGLPWRLAAFGMGRGAASVFDALEPVIASVPFAVRTLAGISEPGVRLLVAATEPLSPSLLRCIDAAFGLDGPDAVRYDGEAHCVGFEGDLVRAARLSGTLAAERWLFDLWQRAVPSPALRRLSSLPEGAGPDIGRVICSCYQVGEAEIDAVIAHSPTLEALKARLRCGTSCGSCLPELRRKLPVHRAEAVHTRSAQAG
ncbi:MAG: molybdopterin-dependent oxidoreductase, partial [Betaproteobacteria bacterium]|nr:molybdopterin-dependent oxidoreductase [Betaproteobacteria bacterium]